MVKSPVMRISLLAACVATLGTVAPAAQTRRSAPPSAAPETTARGFTVPVVYKTLPNGLRVVVSENHAAPVVVVEVMYRIGFRIEPKNRTGFAHLFEHLMFQRSEHVGKFEHVRIVNEHGAPPNATERLDHTKAIHV